jgi:hypothetical protein
VEEGGLLPPVSERGPRFGAGLVPETQVTAHQKHLPLKRPNMLKDPNWTPHCGTLNDDEDEAIITIRCKHQKLVSYKINNKLLLLLLLL